MVTTAHPNHHRHPVGLAASRDHEAIALSVIGPSFAEVQVLDRSGAQLAAIKGARGGGWTGAGYCTTVGAQLLLWNRRDQLVPLGPTPPGGLHATSSAHAWFLDGSTLTQVAIPSGAARVVHLEGPPLPGVTVAEDGQRALLRRVEASDTSSLVLVHVGEDLKHVWKAPGWCVEGVAGAAGGRWVATRMTADTRRRQVVLLDERLGEIAVLHEDDSPIGFVRWPAAVAHGHHAAYIAVVDGWPHLVVHDLRTDAPRPVMPGPHEDLTDVDDAPVFAPDGATIAFNSSRAHHRQRHLYVAEVEGVRVGQATFEAGATGAKAWLDPDTLAYVQASVTAPPSVRVVSGVATARPVRLATVRVGPSVRAAPPISLDVPGSGATIPADLYLPRGFDDGRAHPALVYAHGGIFRHMTQGFSTSATYALLHHINLRLLELGFVVLSVDYRGSTGYGLAFEQANHDRAGVIDVDDCAAGARWLALQPWVRATSIGIWGISWGGTMTMGALVRHPDLFAAGVSLAGIWDFEQRASFWNALQVGQPIYFDGRMPRRPVGPAVDPRHEASPRAYAQRLRSPLLSFHGTADVAVDYAQQTLLERDAAAFGLPVETVTFDGEAHTFTTAAAWRTTLDRMEEFLERTLGTPDA